MVTAKERQRKLYEIRKARTFLDVSLDPMLDEIQHEWGLRNHHETARACVEFALAQIRARVKLEALRKGRR